MMGWIALILTTAPLDLPFLQHPREIQEVPAVRLIQVFPSRDSFPEDSTVVRVGYTSTELVVYARCYQKAPIHAPSRRRDATGLRYGKEDVFSVVLAPSGRGGDVYFVSVNPRGAYADFSSGGEWDTEVHVDARIRPWGWEVTLRIPFRNLAYAQTAWGMDFSRIIQATGVFQLLTPRENVDDYTQIAEVQLDFSRIQRPWTVHLVAVPTLRLESDTLNLAKARLRGGLTMRARRSQESLLEATVLPDFSEVDVDIQEFDLSLLPVNYPEKRPFFVEGRAFLAQPRTLVRTRNFYLPRWGVKFYATGARSSFIAYALNTNVLTDTSTFFHVNVLRYTYRPSPALTLGAFSAAAENGDVYAAADGSLTFSDLQAGLSAQLSRNLATRSNHLYLSVYRGGFTGLRGGGSLSVVDPGFIGDLNRIAFYFDDVIQPSAWMHTTWTLRESPLWLASVNLNAGGRWRKSTRDLLSRNLWVGAFVGPYPWFAGVGVQHRRLEYLREAYGLTRTEVTLVGLYISREGGQWDQVGLGYEMGTYAGREAYSASLGWGHSFSWGLNLGLQAYRVWLPAVEQNPLVVQGYGEWALSPRLFVKPYLAWQRTCRDGRMLCTTRQEDTWNLNLVVAWEPAFLSGVYLAVNRTFRGAIRTGREVFKVQWGVQMGW